MSSASTGFTEDRQRGAPQVGVQYIPTEEETRVFKECNQESFWYRSVPFSVVSMAITQALVVRGTLAPSPRFGALPKVAFAGFCGYLAGKMSYMKTCQEKFKRLENSPLGEALRQRTGMPQHIPQGPQSELSDPNSQSFEMYQPAEAPSQTPSDTTEQGYGYSPEQPMHMGKADDFNAPVQPYEDDQPMKKPILYEDLRVKNRENYEVTLTQKAEVLLKPSPEKEPKRTKNEVKNVYGDTWDE